jgi:hypothetical protein
MPIHESRYEEMTEEPEAGVRALIDFIGLPWDPACLSFYETDRRIRTPSVAQVRQPIYKSSVARWRNYEKHLGPLIEALDDVLPAESAATIRDGAARSPAR